MKYSNNTNRIFGKDWLQYHPFSENTFIDNYYIELCNKVLKIIQQSKVADFFGKEKDKKALACILVSYFEDIISETRLFSSFTCMHKKMYGKELPFYEISDDYYSDEINFRDIYFLIWYQISVHHEDVFIDPYFGNNQAFNDIVSRIYDLFNSDFEKAPQNEKLQNFLKLSANSDVKTIREKLSFIAHKSFLCKTVFDKYILTIIDKYKKNGTVVLDKHAEVDIYDHQIHFIFDKCMPLLAMRTTEYYAEILGEEHSEYQFIKNIPKRIVGCFVIRKIESDGYLIEHLSSKKQIWLSNEFTSFENVKLVENYTVLTICLVRWRNDIWQNQGGCMINTIDEMKGEDVSKHIFDDENIKRDVIDKMGKAFLEITNGKQIYYLRGNREYAEFHLKLIRKHAKILKPDITDIKLDEMYKDFIENNIKKTPFKNNEALGLFFNMNSGMEVYREGIIACIADKANPFYAHEEFDLFDLIIEKSISKEFVNFIIENNLINFCDDDDTSDKFNIMMENIDFLLRFYRQSGYFSKPEISLA